MDFPPPGLPPLVNREGKSILDSKFAEDPTTITPVNEPYSWLGYAVARNTPHPGSWFAQWVMTGNLELSWHPSCSWDLRDENFSMGGGRQAGRWSRFQGVGSWHS